MLYTLLHYSKINTMDIDISLTLMYNRTEYDFKAFSILEGEANEHKKIEEKKPDTSFVENEDQ